MNDRAEGIGGEHPGRRSQVTRWARGLLSALLALAISMLVSTPLAGPVSAHGLCTVSAQNYFLGMGVARTDLTGVRAYIEENNPPLCTQNPTLHGSWSLSWISLDGYDDPGIPGIEIYQGGYAKCPTSSVGSCPYNSGAVYYWVYYARQQGACGAAFNTGFVDLGDASSGSHHFVIKLVTAAPSVYQFYIDGVDKYSIAATAISSCWPFGITQAEYQNEMLNTGDSPGGTTANHELWSEADWQNSSGWHDVDKVVGAGCDANSYTTAWSCVVKNQDGTSNSNIWAVWDQRD